MGFCLRTDQSPVVDDGDQVAEVDHAVSSHIEDTWLWALGLITGDAHANPHAPGGFTAFGGCLDTDILHTACSKLWAAIDFCTACTICPGTAVIHIALMFGDVVDAVVSTTIRALEAAGTAGVHAFFSDIRTCLPRVPGAIEDLKTLELFNIFHACERSKIRVLVAASARWRSRWAVDPSTSLTHVPDAAIGLHTFELVGFNTVPSQIRILVAASTQDCVVMLSPSDSQLLNASKAFPSVVASAKVVLVVSP